MLQPGCWVSSNKYKVRWKGFCCSRKLEVLGDMRLSRVLRAATAENVPVSDFGVEQGVAGRNSRECARVGLWGWAGCCGPQQPRMCPCRTLGLSRVLRAATAESVPDRILRLSPVLLPPTWIGHSVFGLPNRSWLIIALISCFAAARLSGVLSGVATGLGPSESALCNESVPWLNMGISPGAALSTGSQLLLNLPRTALLTRVSR